MNEELLMLASGEKLRYLEHRPQVTGCPLVVALHHAGEDDGLPVSPHFARPMMRALMVPGLQALEAMIVAPDALRGASWEEPFNERAVVALTEHVLARNPELDRRRVLLAGYSMGGLGTWSIGPRHASLFTALMPMAAAVRWPAEMEPAQPIVALHSRADELFAHAEISAAVEALRARGARVELRMVEDIGHFELSRFAEVVRDAVPSLVSVWPA